MAPKAKNTKSSKSKSETTGTLNKGVGNYEKHPFFVKKANEAREFLKKAGLPDRDK